MRKAASAATQPGDTVIVADGTYGNEGVVAPSYVVTLYYSGTSANPITFKAQNRGKVILDAMNTSTGTSCNGAAAYFNLLNASYIVIQGFVIQRGCDEGIHSNDSAHDITIRWNEIRNIANRTVTDQIGRDGIYLNNSAYNYTFDGNIFHDIGRTGGISPLHFDHGIYSHARNMTIINNVFYNMNRGWSIQLADGASNWLVANNTFAFGNANGAAGHVMFWGSNSDIKLHNNTFYMPNSAALTQYAASISGTFANNLVYGTSTILSGGGLTVGSNQIGSDPMFVSANGFDFRPKSGAPTIDAGANFSAVTTDHDGAPRPKGSSTDVGAFEYGSTTTVAPPTISSVFASGLGANSAVINWSTNEPTTSYVQYGLSGYTNTTPVDSTLTTTHSVTLSGLSASTLYHFRVGSTNASGSAALSGDATFTTTAVAPSLSLSASPSALSVVQGSSATSTISVSGSGQTVSFSAPSLPAGVSAAFSPASCTAPCTTAAKFSATTAATAGTYSVAVAGSGSSGAQSTTLNLTVTATASTSTGDITSGLTAKWSFTDGTGNAAYDSSGNGNNAALTNPTWWTSDLGVTCWFSGSQSFGTVAESPSLKMSDQLTVAFWLRPSVNSNTDPRVISKQYTWDVKLNGSNRYPQFSAGGRYAMMDSALPLLTWNHVVFTFSNGVVKGYVNGVQKPMLANTFAGSQTLAQYANGITIATDQSNPYIGSLDDMRLYNRALSPADVTALYSVLKPASTTTTGKGASKK